MQPMPRLQSKTFGVLSIGGADDVIVSATTRDLLEGSGLVFEDAGEHELKGLPGVRHVFRLASPAP